MAFIHCIIYKLLIKQDEEQEEAGISMTFTSIIMEGVAQHQVDKRTWAMVFGSHHRPL